ncbi:MAG: hypothetical protein IJV99_00385 [Clostridia bacterium]|nr:hypothetical protein [Clostridia bacterium]
MEDYNIERTVERVKRVPIFLKVLSAIIYLVVTAFLIYGLIGCLDDKKVKVSLAFYLTFSVIIFGSIGNIISTIVSLVGLIISIIKRKNGGSMADVIYFIVMVILPALTEIVIILITKGISKNY